MFHLHAHHLVMSVFLSVVRSKMRVVLYATTRIARKSKPQCARKSKVFLQKNEQKEHIHVLIKKSHQQIKKKARKKTAKKQIKYCQNKGCGSN